MKKISKLLKYSIMLVPALAMGIAFLSPVSPKAYAETEVTCKCGTSTQINTLECGSLCTGQKGCLFGKDGSKDCYFTTIINTILFVIGAISVVMLIYGGVRYTISGGDSGAVTNAKNTILYAIVGVIISVLAFAIVNFVIGALA